MQQETNLSSEQLLEAQEDGTGVSVSCGPALWRKLRAEDGPEARDLGHISFLPHLCGKIGYQYPGFIAGREHSLINHLFYLKIPKICFSSLKSSKETGRKENFYSSLDWELTWVPRRPCRAPRRRRTCPESCPSRVERQVGPSCPRAAITPSSRRVVAPRTSCALVCSWERDGREKQSASKGMLIAGGETVGVASRMNHKS